MTAWRELSDTELFDLSQENQRRLDGLRQIGAQPIGVEEHYLVTMLEHLLGERGTAKAREAHHMWLRDMLDEVEPQVREAINRQKLLAPNIIPTNGRHA